MKNIILIETDNSFIQLLKNNLKQQDLTTEYVLHRLDPSFEMGSHEECVANTIRQFDEFIQSQSFAIDLVLVDIEIFNDLKDTFGLAISKALKNKYRDIPVLNITYHWDEYSLPNIFSEAVLSINDGVLPKTFFTIGFSRDRFKAMFPSLEEKMALHKSPLLGENRMVGGIDYAIITALYEDEFEEIKNCFSESDLKILKIGKRDFFKWQVAINGTQRVIVGAYQSITGMVDASILASEMIMTFQPKYLLMTGVCGGKDDDKINFGDIVLASKVFIFQKGKLNGTTDESGAALEEFQKELEDINLSDEIAPLRPHVKKIKAAIIQSCIDEQKIQGEVKLEVHIEPLACSMSVINKEGYFENLTDIDRKTIAVEMESYGVARACKLVNGGKTTPIIVKSVMDKTKQKTDVAKSLAAFTSAQFVKRLIFDDYLINKE